MLSAVWETVSTLYARRPLACSQYPVGAEVDTRVLPAENVSVSVAHQFQNTF